jgi:hypothetical protein
MKRPITGWILAGSLAAFMAGLAVAQVARVPQQTPAGEPRDIAGLTAAINDARGKLNLPKLAWSAELAAKAETTAQAASGGACSLASAEKTASTHGAAIYWASALRRLGGDDAAQSISPSYVVASWREGRREYEGGKGSCRSRTGPCDAYARMVASKASLLGCARTVCSNQAQVWACHYSE